jgi:hypothetical protein
MCVQVLGKGGPEERSSNLSNILDGYFEQVGPSADDARFHASALLGRASSRWHNAAEPVDDRRALCARAAVLCERRVATTST